MKKYFLIAIILIAFWGCKENAFNPTEKIIHIYSIHLDKSMYSNDTHIWSDGTKHYSEDWYYNFINNDFKNYNLFSDSTLYFFKSDNDTSSSQNTKFDFNEIRFCICNRDSNMIKLCIVYPNKYWDGNNSTFPDTVPFIANGTFKVEFR